MFLKANLSHFDFILIKIEILKDLNLIDFLVLNNFYNFLHLEEIIRCFLRLIFSIFFVKNT